MLALAVPNIFHGCENWSRDPDHDHLGEG